MLGYGAISNYELLIEALDLISKSEQEITAANDARRDSEEIT